MTPDRDPCTACSLDPARRAFLREAALAVAAALVALGAPRGVAAAPLALTAPVRAAGSTRAYAIPAADGAVVDRENEVIVVRWRGLVYAFNLACPHQRTALRWLAADARFQCPKHKSKYQPDGTFISGRATRGMDRFGVRRAGDTVVVDLDALHKQSDDPQGWAAAAVKL
jgi:nitrite reductase/ring-hydroxylating ferredoxin subunit